MSNTKRLKPKAVTRGQEAPGACSGGREKGNGATRGRAGSFEAPRRAPGPGKWKMQLGFTPRKALPKKSGVSGSKKPPEKFGGWG